jgi:hypothetical protein
MENLITEKPSCSRRSEVIATSFELDALASELYRGRVEKKFASILRRIQRVRGLSEDEKILFARSLAASPDQRWRLHENFLRSHGLFTRSERRKHGFK